LYYNNLLQTGHDLAYKEIFTLQKMRTDVTVHVHPVNHFFLGRFLWDPGRLSNPSLLITDFHEGMLIIISLIFWFTTSTEWSSFNHSFDIFRLYTITSLVMCVNSLIHSLELYIEPWLTLIIIVVIDPLPVLFRLKGSHELNL
jgi:hypothetical protein